MYQEQETDCVSEGNGLEVSIYRKGDWGAGVGGVGGGVLCGCVGICFHPMS